MSQTIMDRNISTSIKIHQLPGTMMTEKKSPLDVVRISTHSQS